jgi:hypothetical protein
MADVGSVDAAPVIKTFFLEQDSEGINFFTG